MVLVARGSSLFPSRFTTGSPIGCFLRLHALWRCRSERPGVLIECCSGSPLGPTDVHGCARACRVDGQPSAGRRRGPAWLLCRRWCPGASASRAGRSLGPVGPAGYSRAFRADGPLSARCGSTFAGVRPSRFHLAWYPRHVQAGHASRLGGFAWIGAPRWPPLSWDNLPGSARLPAGRICLDRHASRL